MIYLDNSATTHKKPFSVLKATFTENMNSANPGRASHKLSMNAFFKIDKTRELLSTLFKASNPERFILTPNATYALNFAIKGIVEEYDHVITTSMEHNSVLRPLHSIPNIEITVIKGDSFGKINIKEIEQKIKSNTSLIAVNHSSNVNGIIQDIKGISKIARNHNIPLLIDASQSAGILDINAKDFDLIAFPGHKSLYGPQGTGGLYVAPGIHLKTVIEGGTGTNSKDLFNPFILPERLESGTLNTPGFYGLGKGVKFVLSEGVSTICKYEHYLLNYALNELKNINNLILYSPCKTNEITNLFSFNIKDRDSTEISEILNNEYNICTRPGYHCAYPAHVTLNSQKYGTVRVSVSYFNTLNDIKKLVDAVNNISKN